MLWTYLRDTWIEVPLEPRHDCCGTPADSTPASAHRQPLTEDPVFGAFDLGVRQGNPKDLAAKLSQVASMTESIDVRGRPIHDRNSMEIMDATHSPVPRYWPLAAPATRLAAYRT